MCGADEDFMTVAQQTEHVLESDLELYLKDQVNEESLAAMDAHLGSCQACSGKLAERDKCLWHLAELTAHESVFDGERRRHPRVVTNEPASLQVLNPFSVDIWDVRILDVSKSGLRTHTSKNL